MRRGIMLVGFMDVDRTTSRGACLKTETGGVLQRVMSITPRVPTWRQGHEEIKVCIEYVNYRKAVSATNVYHMVHDNDVRT